MQYVLFTSLVLGTIALGGIAEGKKWGVISWFILCWYFPLLSLFVGQWGQAYWQFFMWLIAVHGSITLIIWLKQANAKADNNV